MPVYPLPLGRAVLFPDHNYQQGLSAAMRVDLHNIGGGYGGWPHDLDVRLIASWFEAGTWSNSHPTTSLYHPYGYKLIYAPPSGGQGWYLWSGSYYKAGATATDRWWNNRVPGVSGSSEIVNLQWVISMRQTDQVMPTWPQGHPLGPRMSQKYLNTLSYTLPGWETDLPFGDLLLIDINVAWFNNKNCYYVTCPKNEIMSRHYNYWPIANSYSAVEDLPAGTPVENAIDRGGAITIDYQWFGNPQETAIPPRQKAFGGSYTPAYCQTFSYLVRGAQMPTGFYAGSQLGTGGPLPT